MNTLNIESPGQKPHVSNSQSFSQARALITGLFAILTWTWSDNEQEDKEESRTAERE